MLGLGLVLTYRASGVVNFAHGAVGMFVAYQYYGLRNYDALAGERGGELILPVLGLPERVHIVDRPTVFTALCIALISAAIMGALIYLLIFRPLRHAPPLARVVASLGLFLYLTTVAQLRMGPAGGASMTLASLLPRGSVQLGDAVVPIDRFVLAGIALGLALALASVFRFTRFGLATRGAAESEKGALLLGFAPDRLACVNWVIATVLAGLSVILITGVETTLDPTTTSLRVVPALAAALLGRLDSFLVTTVAGLAIGMAQAGIYDAEAGHAWVPGWIAPGALREALPVLLILVAITVRGQRLPTRSTLVDQRLPASPSPRHPLLAALVIGTAAVIGLLTLDSQWRLAIVVSVIASVIALSSVVVTGYVGQISLAQLAFAGFAGFMTAKLAADGGIPFPWSPLLAVVLTVAVGILTGLPAVRVRGMTLAIATIGAAIAIEELVFKSPSIGGIGGRQLPRPSLFGIDLGFSAPGAENFRAEFGISAVIVAALCTVAVANLRRSPSGLRWLAVRANERAAAAAGIDVARAKLSAFAVASALAGIGGVLLAYQLPTLSPQSFMVVGALAALALTYLGGVASISGALIAGVLASGGILTRLNGGTTGSSSNYQFAVSGIMLIVVAILYPDGLSGAARALAQRARQRWATR